jgi:hypothetical protein
MASSLARRRLPFSGGFFSGKLAQRNTKTCASGFPSHVFFFSWQTVRAQRPAHRERSAIPEFRLEGLKFAQSAEFDIDLP